MITINRINRLTLAGGHDRLLNEVLASLGRPVPLVARLRLSEPDALAATALGLALRRAVDLSYIPGPEPVDLAERLLDHQREDGSFGTIPATASALAGLLAMYDLSRPWGGRISAPRSRVAVTPALMARLEEAIERAWHFLHASQRWGGGGRGGALFASSGQADGLIGDALDSAIIVWLLGRDPRLARRVDAPRLIEALARAAKRDAEGVGMAVRALVRADEPRRASERQRQPLPRPAAPRRAAAAVKAA